MDKYSPSLRRVTPFSLRFWITAMVLVLLAVVPAYSQANHQPFLISFFSRVLVFSLAASGLNLILGFGGLVSFGHALYIGLGAYTVGILSANGIHDGSIHLVAGILGAVIISTVTGAICLRATGVSFIMITLAFAQMFFFLTYSLQQYGGDDGLRIAARSHFSYFEMNRPATLYWFILAACVLVMLLVYRITHARLGMVLRGCKSNEARMVSLGFPTLRYKLFAYVISANICMLAGFFLGNLTLFTSPAYLSWNVSGDLLVMTVLGGLGTVTGPVIGAIVLLCCEELLKNWTVHWMAYLGIGIVVIAIFAKRGLYGSLPSGQR